MTVFLEVLAIIVFLIWLGLGFQWFRYMNKLPVFTGANNQPDGWMYPSLSVIVPACNEAESIEQAVTQLINQDYHNLEVIVVNDRSTDQTGQILANLSDKYPNLKVITISDLPSSWLGKNHAIYQGAKEATGEWLLFTDADVMFSPDSLKKTVRYAQEHSLDHLTISPNFIVKGIFGKALTAYILIAITFIGIFSKCIGIGAFNLIRRPVYDAIGGYEAIALQPIDDLSLGKLVVKHGYKQRLGFSKGFISVKGYDGLFATFKGLEKNQFAGVNYSVLNAFGGCFYMFLTNIYPFIGIFLGSIWSRILCVLSVLIILAIYNYSMKYIDNSRFFLLFNPISAFIYDAIIINSTVRMLKQGGMDWRGTFYSLDELRKHTL